MSPNDPEDQPPKVPPPRSPGVDRDRLPRPPDDEPVADTPPSQLPRHWKSWLVGAVGVLALLIVLLSNSGGSPKSQVTVTVPAPAPAPAGATGTATETATEPTPPPSPPPEGPKKVWENEATFVEGNDYNIDAFPIEIAGVSGFEVYGKSWTIINPGKMAAWTGSGTPSLADCVNVLNSASEENGVKIESLGQWFCAETASHLVARLRFDSLKPPANKYTEGGSYKFFIIVYKPGHK